MDLSFVTANLTNPATLIPAIQNAWKAYFELEAFKQYEPETHKVNDRALRPDKTIHTDVKDANGNITGSTTTISYVTRIALAIQKLIVSRQSAFLTGGEVTLTPIKPTESAAYQTLYDIVTATWRANKLDYKNGEISKAVKSQLECAEVWYSEKGEYGKVKMRCKFYQPADGYDLWPVWNDHGDLIAFAFGYDGHDQDGKPRKYMYFYTAEQRIIYYQDGGKWIVAPPEDELPNPFPLPYGKIPVIYYSQPKSAWQDVQNLIERLEKLLSGVGDTNDYNGSPILFSNTEIESLPKKGEAGKLVKAVNAEGEGPAQNAKLEYVAWDAKPEAVIFEADKLMELIYTLTQTPNISFEAMQGLGDLSGEALKRIFTDAHLKAIDGHQGWYGEGIQRRLNFLIAACAESNGLESARDLEIVPSFGLFDVAGLKERVELAIEAKNGGIISAETASKMSGLVEDAAKEQEAINAEAKPSQSSGAQIGGQ